MSEASAVAWHKTELQILRGVYPEQSERALYGAARILDGAGAQNCAPLLGAWAQNGIPSKVSLSSVTRHLLPGPPSQRFQVLKSGPMQEDWSTAASTCSAISAAMTLGSRDLVESSKLSSLSQKRSRLTLSLDRETTPMDPRWANRTDRPSENLVGRRCFLFGIDKMSC